MDHISKPMFGRAECAKTSTNLLTKNKLQEVGYIHLKWALQKTTTQATTPLITLANGMAAGQ